MWTIPTIEEIYNEYHRQKFFQKNGIYPRPIKNFDSLNDPKKKEYLLRFQNMIKRNRNTVNWKLYILAIAEVTQGQFDLSLLGTLKGTKIAKIGKNAFANMAKTVTISVPNSKKAAYKKLLKKAGYKQLVK